MSFLVGVFLLIVTTIFDVGHYWVDVLVDYVAVPLYAGYIRSGWLFAGYWLAAMVYDAVVVAHVREIDPLAYYGRNVGLYAGIRLVAYVLGRVFSKNKTKINEVKQ